MAQMIAEIKIVSTVDCHNDDPEILIAQLREIMSDNCRPLEKQLGMDIRDIFISVRREDVPVLSPPQAGMKRPR